MVRTARKTLGLTQVELAARAGISQSFLSWIEKGRRRPGPAARNRLAAALGWDVDELFEAV